MPPEENRPSQPEEPRIILRAPDEGGQVTAPFELHVEFVPSAGASIDLDSLRVRLRLLWDIDITEQVKPYASVGGIRVRHASFPRGRHTVIVTIRDSARRSSSRTMTVAIV